MLSEISQSEKGKYCTIQLIRSIQTNHICRNIGWNEACQRLETRNVEFLNEHRIPVLPDEKSSGDWLHSVNIQNDAILYTQE